MADFLGGKQDEEEPQEEEASTFKIGDKEYSQDELNELVELGNFAREVETKQNTKLDKLYPEFTRKSQKVKELEAEMEKMREEQTKQSEPQQGDLTQEQIAEARKAGRKIGFLTEDSMQDVMSKQFRQFYLQERAAEKLLDSCEGLASKIDGKDGRPAFKTEEILSYMQETGFKDPEKAYKDKYESEIDAWKAEQINKARKPGMTTIEGSTAGSKQPKPVKVTGNNLEEVMREALEGKI